MSKKIDYDKLEPWKEEDALCSTVGELIDLLSAWDPNLPLSFIVDCGFDVHGDQEHDCLWYEAIIKNARLGNTIDEVAPIFVNDDSPEPKTFATIEMKAVLQASDDSWHYTIFKNGVNQLYLQNQNAMNRANDH